MKHFDKLLSYQVSLVLFNNRSHTISYHIHFHHGFHYSMRLGLFLAFTKCLLGIIGYIMLI